MFVPEVDCGAFTGVLLLLSVQEGLPLLLLLIPTLQQQGILFNKAAAAVLLFNSLF